VFEAAIWVKSMYMINRTEKKEKRKNMEIEQIVYINLHLKKIWNGIYSLLMRADARGSNDTIYCM